ncbi:MAG: hypothetical protein KDA89_15865 [Planctomycetaceae bacterium]|nr:hypothetical protein [Planctomycetaceae bacterium]
MDLNLLRDFRIVRFGYSFDSVVEVRDLPADFLAMLNQKEEVLVILFMAFIVTFARARVRSESSASTLTATRTLATPRTLATSSAEHLCSRRCCFCIGCFFQCRNFAQLSAVVALL